MLNIGAFVLRIDAEIQKLLSFGTISAGEQEQLWLPRDAFALVLGQKNGGLQKLNYADLKRFLSIPRILILESRV